MAGEFGNLAVDIHQRRVELRRVRGRETQPVDAVDARQILDQQGEVGDAAIMGGASVGVDVLTEQVDFPHALAGEMRRLGEHIVKRPADFLAPGVGHHAEAAILAAALHDRQIRLAGGGAGLGQMVELFDFREADIDLGRAIAGGVKQGGEFVQGLRAEHNIDKGRAPADRLAFLAGDTAAHGDFHAGSGRLQPAPAAELVEHLLLGLFPDRAGVEHENIRLLRRIDKFGRPGLAQQIEHPRRVVLVHLAAVGLDMNPGRGGGVHRPGAGTRSIQALHLRIWAENEAAIIADQRESGRFIRFSKCASKLTVAGQYSRLAR